MSSFTRRPEKREEKRRFVSRYKARSLSQRNMKGKRKREKGGATDLSTYNKSAGEEIKMAATKGRLIWGKASLLACLLCCFLGFVGGVYDSNGGRGEKRKKLCQTWAHN